eukprot:3938021-Rhodomonas_salina.1
MLAFPLPLRTVEKPCGCKLPQASLDLDRPHIAETHRHLHPEIKYEKPHSWSTSYWNCELADMESGRSRTCTGLLILHRLRTPRLQPQHTCTGTRTRLLVTWPGSGGRGVGGGAMTPENCTSESCSEASTRRLTLLPVTLSCEP